MNSTYARMHRKIFSTLAKDYGKPLDREFIETFLGGIAIGIEYGYISVTSDFLEEDQVRVIDVFFTDHSVMQMIVVKDEQSIQIADYDSSHEAMDSVSRLLEGKGINPANYQAFMESRVLDTITPTDVVH